MADFSDADVQSLAQKLTQFKETLTQGEQAAMAAVIQRGIPPAEDVAGFQQGPGGANPDRRSTQLGDPPLAPLGNIFTVPQFEHDRPDRSGR